MKLEKRQLILASMVLALGAAVYLNWTLSDGIPLQTTQTAAPGDALSDKLVNAGLVSTVEANAETDPEANAVDAQAAVEAARTFSEARVARQQARDTAIEMLEDVLEDVNSDADAKQEAIAQAAAIAQNILKETNMENLIKAKGCEDCMVYLEEEHCTVVLGSDFDENKDLVIIRDIVMGQTGFDADAVKVICIGQ